MNKKYVIIIGTGRCGTVSIAKLIDGCKNCCVYHEYKAPQGILPWNFNISKAQQRLKELQSFQGQLVGDTAFYYLNYIEFFDNHLNNLKVVHIWRDKEEVVESFMRKTEKGNILRNHWHSSKRKDKIYEDSIWDIAFPDLDYTTTKREAIAEYWELYMNRVRNLKTKNEIFWIYVYDLNKKEKQKELFDYLEIPEKDRVYRFVWENKG